MPTLTELGIDRLPPHERAAIAEAIWESLAFEQIDPDIEAAHWAEIERRLAEADADPDGGIPWEQVKAELLAELD